MDLGKLYSYTNSSYNRFSGYLIGIMLGFNIDKISFQKNKLTSRCVLQKCAIVSSILAMISALRLELSQENFKVLLCCTEILVKLTTAVLFAFFTIYCQYQSETLRKFLSARAFRVLSKLSYTAYLIHPVILTQNRSQADEELSMGMIVSIL